MATAYPTALDAFTNPTSTDTFDGSAPVYHDVQHSNANDAIEALEAKLGIGASLPTRGKVLTGGASAGASVWGEPSHTNLLTNGGFEIWQRGAGPFTADSAYFADGWHIDLAGSSTVSITRDTANADTGSQYAAAVVYTHNTASTVQQKIEGYHQLRGKPVAISIRVKTSTPSAVRLFIYDGGATTLGAYHSGSGAYETLTHTATIDAGATILLVGVQIAASGTAYLDNAMLVIDSVAADFVPTHPADAIGRCQRYYQVLGGVSSTIHHRGYATAGDYLITTMGLPAQTAVVPTVTKNGTWAVANAGQPIVDSPSTQTLRIYVVATNSVPTSWSTDSADDTITIEANP